MNNTVNTMAPVVYLLIGFAFLLGLGVTLFFLSGERRLKCLTILRRSPRKLKKQRGTFLQIAKGELGKAQ